MVKLCLALGLLQGSQNLWNRESSCFCFDLVDFSGCWESDGGVSFWRFSIIPVTSLLSEIKAPVCPLHCSGLSSYEALT